MPEVDNAKEGLSMRQAAEYLGVHYNSMRSYVNAGEVPVTRFGPRGHIIRIHKADLDAMRRQSGQKPEGGKVA